MDFHTTFRTDPSKLKDGVEIPFKAGDLFTARIRRMNNKEYTAHIQALADEYRKKHKVLAVPDEQYRLMQCEALAKNVLVGWDNLTDKGVPVSYSEVNASTLLGESDDFRTWVIAQALDLDNFTYELETNTSKNS
jgi:hypothetical protein